MSNRLNTTEIMHSDLKAMGYLPFAASVSGYAHAVVIIKADARSRTGELSGMERKADASHDAIDEKQRPFPHKRAA